MRYMFKTCNFRKIYLSENVVVGKFDVGKSVLENSLSEKIVAGEISGYFIIYLIIISKNIFKFCDVVFKT